MKLPGLLLLLASALWAEAPLRVRIVTGGHDHAPSFYTMFDSMPGFQVAVEPHPRL